MNGCAAFGKEDRFIKMPPHYDGWAEGWYYIALRRSACLTGAHPSTTQNMNTRNTVLGIAIGAILLAAIWWMNRAAPAAPADTSTPKPATATTAPAATALVPPKAVIEAPTTAPVIPTASASPTATAAAPKVDPELAAAVKGLIAALKNQDGLTFMRDYANPGAIASVMLRLPPDTTQEQRDQLKAQLQQRQTPEALQQMAQVFAQDPATGHRLQALGEALELAQNNPPIMNEAGDQATYTLSNDGSQDLPPAVIMIRYEGKWVLGSGGVARSSLRQRQNP